MMTQDSVVSEQSKEGFFSRHWFPLTLGIFLFPIWCLLLAVFGFVVGIPVTKWHAVAAFASTILSIAWACRGD